MPVPRPQQQRYWPKHSEWGFHQSEVKIDATTKESNLDLFDDTVVGLMAKKLGADQQALGYRLNQLDFALSQNLYDLTG